MAQTTPLRLTIRCTTGHYSLGVQHHGLVLHLVNRQFVIGTMSIISFNFQCIPGDGRVMHEMMLHVICPIDLFLSTFRPFGFGQFDRIAIVRLQNCGLGHQTGRFLAFVAMSIAVQHDGSTLVRSKFRTQGLERQYAISFVELVQNIFHALVMLTQRYHVFINVERCQPFGMRSEAVQAGCFRCILRGSFAWIGIRWFPIVADPTRPIDARYLMRWEKVDDGGEGR
mmetsp:Transcript_11723/g.17674  ORF Transcript_11723/g.17674 Transcript_11723/m.17674 type:complete len:226 (-) Transcript_11723:181-858(-)